MEKGIRWAVGLVVLALGLGMTSCSTGGTAGDSAPAATPGTPETGVRLTVRNDQRTETEIWVYVDGARSRLGRVRSGDQGTFIIPTDRVRRMRMEFRIYGGPVCVTRDASLGPAEVVNYNIPVDITMFDAVCR